MPPVKAVFPSTTRIFRWSRLLSRRDRMGTKGLKTQHWMPVRFSSSAAYSRGRVNMQPMSSYIRRTSTPSLTFSVRMSRMVSHMTPSSMMKYSRNIYRSAFLSSSTIRAKQSSPRGKYSVWVPPYTGQWAMCSRYRAWWTASSPKWMRLSALKSGPRTSTIFRSMPSIFRRVRLLSLLPPNRR